MASFQWARIFAEQGHNSHCMCYPDSPLAEKLRHSQLISQEIAFQQYFSPRATWQLRQYIVRHGIDGVFLQSLKDLWVVSPALVGLPCKLIGFAQMWLEGINKKDFLHTLIHKRMDALVTLTPLQSAQVLRCIPFPSEKTHVIPNSIDTRRFSPRLRSDDLRRELGAANSDILVGIVGRLDPQKGQRELIESFAQARRRAPQLPLKLALVGDPTPSSGDEYRRSLEEAIKKHNLDKDVVLAGFRSDIPSVMASLDIFVLNSYQEAFGFVLVEAMASGTAVIATDSGGIPDVVDDGRAGWLVPPKNIDALADTLIEVASHNERRRARAEEGRVYALEKFDELGNFKKISTLLET